MISMKEEICYRKYRGCMYLNFNDFLWKSLNILSGEKYREPKLKCLLIPKLFHD